MRVCPRKARVAGRSGSRRRGGAPSLATSRPAARVAGLVAAALATAVAPAPGAAQSEPTVTNVTASFLTGPYTSLSVHPSDSQRVAIGTFDGHVLWSEDAGHTSDTAQALVFRRFDPIVIRSGQRAQFSVRGESELDEVLANHLRRLGDAADDIGRPDERSILLFLALLGQGMQAARWQLWMAAPDSIPEIGAIAWPPGDGPMLMAAPTGILLSDQSRRSWHRVLGGPGPMPRERDLIGLSVGIDPVDPKHMLAATDRGVMVSTTGGYTWSRHPDKALEDTWITRVVWDPDNPQLVFMVSPDAIYLSQDGGRRFEPSFAAEGEIRDLSLSPDAAVVATSDGMQVATSEGILPLLDGKDLVGAVPWRDGLFLAATTEELYLVAPDGSFRSILRTTPSDPYMRLAGNPRTAWLLSRYNILRIGDAVPRGSVFRAPPPRMLLSFGEFERAVLARAGQLDPDSTRLHARARAKLLPQLTARIGGTLGRSDQNRRDEIVLPGQIWQTAASAWDRTHWSIFAEWDLQEIVLGTRDNVSNPNLIIESQIRDKRDQLIQQTRTQYRECAALVADLRRPPADPEVEIAWRMRLEELASYLEWMSGRRVVERTPVEDLKLVE